MAHPSDKAREIVDETYDHFQRSKFDIALHVDQRLRERDDEMFRKMADYFAVELALYDCNASFWSAHIENFREREERAANE